MRAVCAAFPDHGMDVKCATASCVPFCWTLPPYGQRNVSQRMFSDGLFVRLPDLWGFAGVCGGAACGLTVTIRMPWRGCRSLPAECGVRSVFAPVRSAAMDRMRSVLGVLWLVVCALVTCPTRGCCS